MQPLQDRRGLLSHYIQGKIKVGLLEQIAVDLLGHLRTNLILQTTLQRIMNLCTKIVLTLGIETVQKGLVEFRQLQLLHFLHLDPDIDLLAAIRLTKIGLGDLNADLPTVPRFSADQDFVERLHRDGPHEPALAAIDFRVIQFLLFLDILNLHDHIGQYTVLFHTGLIFLRGPHA